MSTDFKMDFQDTLGGWTFEIIDGYLMEIKGKKHMRKHKLTTRLIKDLEKIKRDYRFDDVNRIYHVDELLKLYQHEIDIEGPRW